MSFGFSSALADELAAFICYKRTVGYAYEHALAHLRAFDQYCIGRGATSLDKDTVEGWLELLLEKASPTSTLSEISLIRQLGKYLYANGDTGAFVVPDKYCHRPRTVTPYLLSKVEIAEFFKAIGNYESIQKGEMRKTVYFGLFQTMHACGIRCCEALRLACKDVSFDDAAIDIIDSKGPKSRRLYITSELVELLHRYDSEIDEYFPDRLAFFPNTSGGFPSISFIERGFNYIWDAAGLVRPEKGTMPNPYAFRHHFAFANIARWAKEGRDVHSMMPYLMRYMGHSSYQSTFYYIHLSPDMLADIPAQTQALERVIPEVTFHD